MSYDARLYGETAVTRGFVTQAQLDQALQQQAGEAEPRPLGEILVQLGHLTRPQANAIEKLREVLESGANQQPAAEEEPDPGAALDLTGHVLGGCLVLERVGMGSMGTTYRAHHLRLDRDVLIKVLHPRLVEIEGNLERFANEARAAANLEHPNIVSIYDFDSDGDYHFIVMQFVRGQNLRQVLDNRGALGARRALWIGARVLEGLAHAHQRKVVHRDIKPANLLITPAPAIKITDFGLVRILSLTTSERISVFGEIIGTPQDMAPEQASCDEIDPRTDLYSLGISLHELIAGRPPFTGASTMEVLEKHIMDPLPSLLGAVPDATPGIEAFLQKLCAKAPEDRYASASEALAALQLLRAGDGTTRRLSRESAPAMADPSRDLDEAPAIISPAALGELKERLRRSRHLVAFEEDSLDQPPEPDAEAQARGDAADDSLIEDSFADVEVTSALAKARQVLRRAVAQGHAERVIPQLLKDLLQSGHVDEVVALEKEAERALPTSAAPPFFVGLAYARQGDQERARAKLALTVALAPDHLPARLHLAKVMVGLGLVDDAVQTLVEANQWHPRSAKAAIRLAEVLYMVKRDPEAAIPAYERAIELVPTRWRLRLQLAWILYEIGRLAKAEAVVKEVIAWGGEGLAPGNKLLTKIQKKRGRTSTSPQDDSEVGAEGPGPETSARLDAIRLASAGSRWDRVLQVAESGLSDKPRSVPLLLARGRALVELGQLSEAVNAFSLALAVDPDNPEATQALTETQEARRRQASRKG